MDNPAVTPPASSRLRSTQRSDTDSSGNGTKRQHSGSDLESRAPQDKSHYVSKNEVGWRRVVRNFSPSWFSVTMGTGAVSLIFHNIPWQAQWLYYLSIIFFVLNVCLFIAALFVSFLRYTIWPEIWTVMIQDPNNSLFLGTAPMGFGTIINMWVAVCVPAWGNWAAYFGWGMWMIDAAVSVAVTVGLGILLMMESHQRSLDTITATLLLPIATTIVAASAGSEVASVLPNPEQALGTIITCYIMWGMSVPMAFGMIVIYFQRLALHKMPSKEVIVSAFLPLGPLGLGGFTILNLGRLARDIFPQTGTLDPAAGLFAYHAGFFTALIMFSWGLLFLAFALAAVNASRPLPFNMGWWGFTFPLGVFSISTITIGTQLPSLFFRVLGTIFGVAVILLWIVIAVRTAQGAWKGHLFVAPCLANLKKEEPIEDDEEEKQGLSIVESGNSNGSVRRTPPGIDPAIDAE